MGKVILISIDGVRPDGLLACGNDYVKELKKKASYTMDAQTVSPSVTLPCHLSMFYSVPPERHGTLTNTYAVPVRPVDGLFEALKAAEKRSAMFYDWEQMRDIERPGCLEAYEYIDLWAAEHTGAILTERAIQYAKANKPDFIYLYMGETDSKGGHVEGWMSQLYLDYISESIDNVKRVIEELGDEYTVIITSDHGGHDRGHGTQMPEDMTIPMFFVGKEFTPEKELKNVSILDITPTIADLMGINAKRDWEGKSVLDKED